MDKFFIVRNTLVEIKDSQLVKSDIKIPDNINTLTTSIDSRILAICADINYILIYELIDRKFVLKYKILKTMLVIKKFWNRYTLHYYIRNFLILLHKTETSTIYEIVDLDDTDKNLNSFAMFHGAYPTYCNEILSFPPTCRRSEIKYNNLNLADKTITHEFPYFMKKILQIERKYKTNYTYTAFAISGITIFNDHYYQTITGILLGSGEINYEYDKNYSNHFVKAHKMDIAPDAPIIEYEYEGLYIYEITSTAGSLTKSAVADI